MVSVTVDGGDVSGMSEFDAEKKDGRKPNERLHAGVGTERNGGRGM